MDDQPNQKQVAGGPQHGYVDRYCAFIDILGFRGLIRDLNRNANHFLALREVLRKIHTPVGWLALACAYSSARRCSCA
jgi:hypothetical protein